MKSQGISSKQMGTIAESQVVTKLLQEGFGVSWAVGDNVSWDVVSDWRGKVSRLQIKATSTRASRGTWRSVAAHGSGLKQKYDRTQIDALVCVLPWAMFVVPAPKLEDVTLSFWEPGKHPRYSTKRFSLCKYEWAKERWDFLK